MPPGNPEVRDAHYSNLTKTIMKVDELPRGTLYKLTFKKC